MLTSYWVHCPHYGCYWSGDLLPEGDAGSFRGAVPANGVVVFRCPACLREWKARVVGDDVVALPLDEPALS